MSACAGHFPEGDEDAMRRVAVAWTDTADTCDAIAVRHADTAGQEKLAISGQATEAKGARNKQLAEDLRNSAQCCRLMSDQLNTAARDIEYTKLLVIFTGITLLAQLAIDIALVGVGSMKAAAEAAWRAASRAVAGRVKTAEASAMARRSGIPLAKVTAIGVGLGAGTGAFVDFGAQWWQKEVLDTRDEIDWGNVGRSTFIGAVGGGAGVLTALRLAPGINKAMQRIAGRSSSNAVRYGARISGALLIGGVGGLGGGVAGAGAQVIATGRMPTASEFKAAMVTGFASGFVGAASVFAQPFSPPGTTTAARSSTPPAPDPGTSPPAHTPPGDHSPVNTTDPAAPGSERDFADSERVFRGGGGRPPTAVIVDYIDEHRDRFGVGPICRVLTEHGLKIAPSTYYAAKQHGISDATWADALTANRLFDLWSTNRGPYGVRKLWHTARRAGHNIGRNQVARLMWLTGIDGVVRGRRTTRTTGPGPAAEPRHPDLIGRA